MAYISKGVIYKIYDDVHAGEQVFFSSEMTALYYHSKENDIIT